MERPVFKPLGTPAEELDTPALVVDLDSVESNIATVHRTVQNAGSKLRPRLDTHLCPAIGHMQIRAGGTSGVAVSTVGQAEVFSQFGFDDILIANVAVTRSKLVRVASLANRVTLIVGTDSAKNIDDLGRIAINLGAQFGVALAIRGSVDSLGVSPDDAPELANKILDHAPNLSFAGLMEAPSGKSIPQSEVTTDGRLDAISEAEFKCTSMCMPPPMVAAGGSADYEEVASREDVTEVLAGSYALMDGGLSAVRPELRPAAKILTTVMSHQEHGLVWLDAGQKATGIDTGLPEVVGVPGASVPRMSAEHGGMVLEDGASWDVDLGSKVWLSPHNIANTVNVYDFIHAVRDGRLEAVWEVAGRGHYQ